VEEGRDGGRVVPKELKGQFVEKMDLPWGVLLLGGQQGVGPSKTRKKEMRGNRSLPCQISHIQGEGKLQQVGRRKKEKREGGSRVEGKK